MADRSSASAIVGGFENWQEYEADDGSIIRKHLETGQTVEIQPDGTVVTDAVDVAGSLTAQTVDADNVDIGGADYVSTGEYIPRYTYHAASQDTLTFTDTSYANGPNISSYRILWDDMFPSDVQTAVLAMIEVGNVGTDETISLRLRNTTDSEIIGSEITGITSTGIKVVGPVNYTPTTTSSGIDVKWEWKEDNGSNSSRINLPWFSAGVQL